MSETRQMRRSAHGLGGIVLVLALVATTSGCAQLPVPRANTTPVHIPPPVPVGTPGSEGRGRELTPIDEHERLPPLPEQAGGAPAPLLQVAATPVLDETLARIRVEAADQASPTASEGSSERSEEDGAQSRKTDEAATETTAHGADAVAEAGPRAAAIEALERGNSTSRSERSAIDPDEPARPVDPRELWREGIARLQTLASEQVKSSGTDPDAWSLRARLLELVARLDGPDGQRRNPLWRLVLSALAEEGPSASDQRRRGAEIRAAVDALEDEAPLEITDLQLCRKVSGFGEFEPIDAAACRPGHPMIVYCEMSGLRYAAAGERFRSRLTSSVELVPARGGEPVWTRSLGTAEDTCRRRRRDYYVNYRIALGDNVPPGSYTLRLTQTDETAGRSTTSSIEVTVQP